MNSLLQSRRFWTMLAGIIVTLVLLVVSQYFPESLSIVTKVIEIVAPLVALLILMFTVDEAIRTIADAQVEMHNATLQSQMEMHLATLNVQAAALRRDEYIAGDKPKT